MGCCERAWVYKQIIRAVSIVCYTIAMRNRTIVAIILSAVSSVSVITTTHAATTRSSWTLTAVGDVMLDRYVWTSIKKYGNDYPFRNITSILKGADIVLGNLEGPFTTSTKHAVAYSSLIFNFSPTLAPILKQVGFTTLLLANNHTLNQGQKGLDATRETLKNAGLDYFGDPRNGTNYHLTQTINGERVTFLGYDNLDGKIDTVLTDIRNAHNKGEYVIVVPHWGTEYKLGIQPQLQQQAKQLIDAGADMVLGGHPHVVEPFEIYKGKFIAYSLGNFVFDQYFSVDTQQELMLKLAFTKTSVTIKVIPMQSVSSQPQIASAKTTSTLLNRIADSSAVSTDIRNGIRQGSFTISR